MLRKSILIDREHGIVFISQVRGDGPRLQPFIQLSARVDDPGPVLALKYVFRLISQLLQLFLCGPVHCLIFLGFLLLFLVLLRNPAQQVREELRQSPLHLVVIF